MRSRSAIILSCLFLLLAGCVTVPQEAPVLSRQLQQQLSSLEQAHLALLDRFFAAKREQVEQFIEHSWAPAFTRNFLANEQIAAQWEQAGQNADPAAMQNFLTAIGPTIQGKIAAKRRQLTQPLDEVEQQLRQELQLSYIQARQINSDLTGLLESAARASQQQQHAEQRVEQLLNIDRSRLNAGIGQVDQALSLLLGTSDAVSGQVEQTEAYIASLRQLVQQLSKQGEQ